MSTGYRIDNGGTGSIRLVQLSTQTGSRIKSLNTSGSFSVTDNGSGTLTLGLGTIVGLTPGTYGSSTTIPSITVNSSGIITAISNVTLSSTGSITINGLGDSITAGGNQYQATNVPPASVPAWLPNTAYTITTSVVQNGGNLYQCSQTGTSAASGGPTGTSASITDNGAKWTYLNARCVKNGDSFLAWVQRLSLGQINFDMSQGYSAVQNAVIKVLVINGGSGYAPTDTITGNNGATYTPTIVGGVITAVTVTNSGGSTGSTIFTATVNTSTGSGAILSVLANPSGTFGVGGCSTADMVIRLPDVVASNVDIITVHGGTNDITAGVSAATITANLKICYETIMNSGKKVVAIPILPRNGVTTAQNIIIQRVNKWIRAYCLKQAWANPLGYSTIAIADVTRYMTDGASATGAPVGGAGATAYNMLYDGLHPSPRGAMYIAMAVIAACQAWVSLTPNSTARQATIFDGYDAVLNPTGNVLEGLPWTASTAYTNVGMLVANDTAPVKLYRLVTAGTSAASGGPTGTSGSNVTDGTCAWRYVSGQGLSVFGSGSTAVPTIGSVTGVGNLATGWTLSRASGSAVGTITGTIENPWSDGQAGTRQSLQFSLGSGTVNEQYNISIMNGTLPVKGIQASDAGVAYWVAEAEIEISNVANLMQIYLRAGDSSDQYFNDEGFVLSTQTQGFQMMASAGEMLPIPNSGKYLLRTQPMLMPSTQAGQNLWLNVGFDASGGAASATLLLKINYFSFRKAYIL